MDDRPLLARLTVHGALKVPQITVYFWVIKALSTAMGESTSDYSVHAIDPVIAVLLGFCGFLVSLSLQLWVRRYIAATWLAVVVVPRYARQWSSGRSGSTWRVYAATSRNGMQSVRAGLVGCRHG